MSRKKRRAKRIARLKEKYWSAPPDDEGDLAMPPAAPFAPEPGYIVQPENPPGFGIVRPELAIETPLVTGEVLFDDPFFTVLTPPPFGAADPCYPEYQAVLQRARERINACPPGQESQACKAARERYYEAARSYANCVDLHYGLQRYQNESTAGGTAGGRRKKRT